MVVYPRCFSIGGPLIGRISGTAMDGVEMLEDMNPDERAAAQCALYHYVQCLQLSGQVNRVGQHAVAICLTRQCVEAITVVECALLADRNLSRDLLASWIRGKKTLGALRKELNHRVWKGYAVGLWDRPWQTYYSEFCNAVQPYAHYSRELQGWQLAVQSDETQMDPDGNYLLTMTMGMNSYDPNKATRVTLLHIILTWTLGSILLSNNRLTQIAAELELLKGALEVADELGRGEVKWEQQFWAHEFSAPQSAQQGAPGDAPNARA